MEKLQKGSWVLYQYGFGKSLFYVKAIIGDTVFLGKTEWLVSSHVTVSLAEIKEKALFLKTTKKRWWRFLCITFKDFVCPYEIVEIDKI